MLLIIWRQARGNAGRLVAAGTAVVLGTAFLAAALLGGGVLHRTLAAAVSAGFAGADIIVTGTGPGDGLLDDTTLARLRALPSVAGADATSTSRVGLAGPTGSELVAMGNAPGTAQLQRRLSDGVWPAEPGQVVLQHALAQRLGVGVGDPLEVSPSPARGGPVRPASSVRVVGLLPGDVSPLTSLPPALAYPTDLMSWALTSPPVYDTLLAVCRPGTSAERCSVEVAEALSGRGLQVQTADQATAAAVAEASGDTQVISGFVSAFAVLALFVAGLVITNTLAVLVSQRTRQLALLRCVGATRRQVHRSVLLEAAVLGLVAATVGTALGAGLAAVATAVISATRPTVGIPGTVEITLVSVLAPLALGTAVTVLAALVPARGATRVEPLAALRPAGSPDLTTPGSRWRLALCLVLAGGGGALLTLGVLLSRSGDTEVGLLLGLPGGALSFVGILVGAVFWLPRFVWFLGQLASATGSAVGRLTTANALRNPRRTATTGAALLIGVTLVSLMLVGAATTRATLNSALNTQFPVDLSIGPPIAAATQDQTASPAAESQPAPLPPQLVSAVSAVPGVTEVAGLRSVSAQVSTTGGRFVVTVVGLDPNRATSVVAEPGQLAPLAPGAAVVPAQLGDQLGLTTGSSLTLTAAGTSRTVRIAVTGLRLNAVVLSDADLSMLAPAAPLTRVWARLTPGADADVVVSDVRQAVAVAAGPSTAPPVEGGAVERAGYLSVVDTLLLIVTGLLAVAVLVAVVGVGNTLSLSVLERTRESALLRALGLTRGQLRGMLFLEGLLLAAASALVGTVLGSVYGWAGASVLLGTLAGQPVTLDVPVGQLIAVVAATMLAGALATVHPGRRAAGVTPVEGLAAY